MEGLASPAELQELEAFISAAFATHQLQDPAVVAVEKIGDRPPAWYVRFSGEAKANYSAEFTLNQRSLHFSTYFIPPPEENQNDFHRHLLQRNTKLFGMAFVVGQERRHLHRGPSSQPPDHGRRRAGPNPRFALQLHRGVLPHRRQDRLRIPFQIDDAGQSQGWRTPVATSA